MKIACSSASFAHEIRRGELTLLDWLDIAANELEMDGVVFDTAHLARDDAEYLAQMKKAATDLGLTVAALAAPDALETPEGAGSALAAAVALGAPLLLVRAPVGVDDGSWGRFTDVLKTAAGLAKRANVTLAVRNAAGTLCADPSDLKRSAKDVDSAWLRFALDLSDLTSTDDARELLAKTVIVAYDLGRPNDFARPGDRTASALIERLVRFRGFVCIDTLQPARDGSFHDAIERFARRRSNALSESASHALVESASTENF
jgi:sugar phosphate isomerase/epimerase